MDHGPIEWCPQPIINTCNGFYWDNFSLNNPNRRPNQHNIPIMFTQSWVGWFKKWVDEDPYRTPEDVAFYVARFFESGGVFNAFINTRYIGSQWLEFCVWETRSIKIGNQHHNPFERHNGTEELRCILWHGVNMNWWRSHLCNWRWKRHNKFVIKLVVL